jgi:hypothetical protein
MTTGISTAALLSYYQAKAGISTSASSSSSSSSSSGSSSTSSTNPTPPWSTQPTARQVNSAVTSALGGASLFNPNAAKISVPNASPNYKNLFALYQGVVALQDLANQAGTTGETTGQLAQLQSAFAGGLGQLQTFLGASPFRGFQVSQGTVNTQAQTSAGVATETDVYDTGVLVSGSPAVAVQAFQGDVQFSVTATLPSGKQKVVDFNLADMGATTRSLSNVVSYLNSQLSAGGVTTRFAVKMTPGAATSTKVNGTTLTTPAGPDQYSLQINGNSVEKLSFSAPSAAPAVFLTQTAGKTTGTNPDSVQQMVKLTTDPAAASDQVFSDTLPAAETSAIATATAPDGSVYVLANVNASTPAGETGSAQTILGTQDVALLKYDSAGNLLSSHVVGATGSASGYGLAISADGSKVAVTGTGTGVATTNGTSSSATASLGFVKVYDKTGQPLWTSTVGNGAPGQVNDAAFGADGSLYVAGTTTISGANIDNGFLAGFSATGAPAFTTSLGSTSQGYVTGLAVSGSQIVTAGVQNGDAVVQSYQIQASGPPTPTATRDLGALQGGNVAGVAVNADGSIIVAGSTHNGALSAGTVTNAYAGGEEAFVANLQADLSPSASDTLAYYGGSGDVRVSAVTTSGGQAYIAGQVVGSTSGTTTYDGFAAQIDPQTGAAGWSDTYPGKENTVAPNSIAVSATGASALDALGLPAGALNFSGAQTLTANSAIVAGQQFTIKTNYSAVPQVITVTADDTLATLAEKIGQASGFVASAKVTYGANGAQQLQIKPSFPGVQVTLGDGPSGFDALPALGLSAGTLTANATATAAKAGATTTAATANSLKANYALALPSTLNLSTPAGIKQAQAVLGASLVTIKQIYTDMTTPPSTKTAGYQGAVPAYLTSEISSYQAALARLQSASGG